MIKMKKKTIYKITTVLLLTFWLSSITYAQRGQISYRKTFDCYLNTQSIKENHFKSLVIYAGVHSKVNHFYRMTAKRFPYSIYYSIKNESAYVVAILPERRNPHWLKEKLSSK